MLAMPAGCLEDEPQEVARSLRVGSCTAHADVPQHFGQFLGVIFVFAMFRLEELKCCGECRCRQGITGRCRKQLIFFISMNTSNQRNDELGNLLTFAMIDAVGQGICYVFKYVAQSHLQFENTRKGRACSSVRSFQ